jgi:hypothetical protein
MLGGRPALVIQCPARGQIDVMNLHHLLGSVERVESLDASAAATSPVAGRLIDRSGLAGPYGVLAPPPGAPHVDHGPDRHVDGLGGLRRRFQRRHRGSPTRRRQPGRNAAPCWPGGPTTRCSTGDNSAWEWCTRHQTLWVSPCSRCPIALTDGIGIGLREGTRSSGWQRSALAVHWVDTCPMHRAQACSDGIHYGAVAHRNPIEYQRAA